MSKNPWKEFEDESYRLEDLGRAATFLLPSHKLRMDFEDSTVEKVLENFLFDNFSAFTTPRFLVQAYGEITRTKSSTTNVNATKYLSQAKKKSPLSLRSLLRFVSTSRRNVSTSQQVSMSA